MIFRVPDPDCDFIKLDPDPDCDFKITIRNTAFQSHLKNDVGGIKENSAQVIFFLVNASSRMN